jgi:hypothetical protein
MTTLATDLPVGTAIDTVLQDVTYTNALPEWLSPKLVDHFTQRAAVEKKIDAYSNGASPAKPFEVWVPRKKPGTKAKWLQLSVTDQMVLQACVGSLAPKIDTKFDRKRVFSYRYNLDKNSLGLTEDQCAAWGAFKGEALCQASSASHVLLLDLEQSSANINHAKFLQYLSQFSTSQVEIKILKTMLSAFEPSGTGIPWINHSMFFLGNAYLSEADGIMERHAADFRRFGDDYCIVGKSGSDMEGLYKELNRDFQQDGRFRINESKTSIFASDQYCARLSKANSESDQSDAYSPVPQGVDPNVLTASLGDTVEHPEQYLNDGVGRSQLSSLQRLRDSLSWSHDAVGNDLIRSSDVLRAAIRLLKTYAPSTDQMWRSVWLIYLMKGIDESAIQDKALQNDFREAVAGVQSSSSIPQVVRFWARFHPGTGSSHLFAQLSDANYEDAGKLCCGE